MLSLVGNYRLKLQLIIIIKVNTGIHRVDMSPSMQREIYIFGNYVCQNAISEISMLVFLTNGKAHTSILHVPTNRIPCCRRPKRRDIVVN